MLRSKKEVDRHVKEIFGKMKMDTDVNRNLKGYNVARLYFNIKEYGSARRYLAEFLSVRPESPEGHKLLGQIYEEQNDKKRAIQAYKTSYEMTPQKYLVLKICELYAHVEEDINVVMHWIELGERLFPQHENIAMLKQLMLTRKNGQSKEELENMYLGMSAQSLTGKLNWPVATEEEDYSNSYDTSFNIAPANSTQLLNNLAEPRLSSTPCNCDHTPSTRHQIEQRMSPEHADAQLRVLLDMQQRTVKALEEQNAQVKAQSEVILAMSQSRVQDLKETMGYYREMVQDQSNTSHFNPLDTHITALENMMKDLQVEVRAIATEVSELRALHLVDKEEKYKREEPTESQVPLDGTFSNSDVPNVLNYLNYYSRPGTMLPSGLFAGTVPPFAPPVSQPSATYPGSVSALKPTMSPGTIYGSHMKLAAQQMVSTSIPLPSTMRMGLQPVTSANTTHPFQIAMPHYINPYNTPNTLEHQKMPEFEHKELLADIPVVLPPIRNETISIKGNELDNIIKESIEQFPVTTDNLFTNISIAATKEMIGGYRHTTTDADVSSESVEEYEPSIDFKPVIEMPDLVPVITGEENDEVMFAERTKLFRYDKINKEFKERGVGLLKILKGKDSGKCRIVMRRDQTQKTCANHVITEDMKLSCMETSERAWVWNANDYADKEIKLENLSARFKTTEIAKKFKEEFDAAVKYASENCSQPSAPILETIISSPEPGGAVSSTSSLVKQLHNITSISADTTSSVSPMVKPLSSLMSFADDMVANSSPLMKPLVPKSEASALSLFGGFTVSSISAPGNQFTFGLASSSSNTVADQAKPTSSIFKNFSADSVTAADSGFSFGIKPVTADGTMIFGQPLTTTSTSPSKPMAAKADTVNESHESVDEYEPNIEFKPVIEMPALVEVKTGEENDETMFAEKAKLYRYENTTKEWKERGLGILKILRNESIGKCRIIMRREKTEKTCANHIITEDMKLTSMEMAKKFWLWAANDYADKEMKVEKLGARFKTDEIYYKFKEEFDAAVLYAFKQQHPSISIAEVVEIPPVACDKSVIKSPLVKSLHFITSNPQTAVTTSSISGGFTVDSITTAGNDFTFGLGSLAIKSVTDQAKPTSSIFGKFSAASIATCGTGFSFGIKPGDSGNTTQSSPPKLFFNAPEIDTESGDEDSYVTDESVASQPIASPQRTEHDHSFKTPTATGSFAYASTPVSLQTPKVSDVSMQFMTPSIFGGNYTASFKTNPTMNVSAFASPIVGAKSSIFGGSFTSVHSTTSSVTSSYSSPITTTSAIGGMPKPNIVNGSSSIFDALTKTNGANNVPDFFKFKPSSSSGAFAGENLQSFGSIRNSKDVSEVTIQKSAFVEQPLFASARVRHDDSVSADEYEPIVNFKPVIELPEVKVETGEENQEQMFCGRAKLYRFDTELKQWKERGDGDVKILKDNISGKARVLMRREQTHKICANHFITADMNLRNFKHSTNAWIWGAKDFADEEMKVEKFTIKFKSEELYNTFQVEFNKARDFTHINQAAESSGGLATAEDEVQILFTKEATYEQVAMAKKLLLPDNFYLYENLPGCSGCIGCTDDDEYSDVSDDDDDNSGYLM